MLCFFLNLFCLAFHDAKSSFTFLFDKTVLYEETAEHLQTLPRDVMDNIFLYLVVDQLTTTGHLSVNIACLSFQNTLVPPMCLCVCPFASLKLALLTNVEFWVINILPFPSFSLISFKPRGEQSQDLLQYYPIY